MEHDPCHPGRCSTLTLKATTATSAESKRTSFFPVWKWTVQLTHIADVWITCFCNGFSSLLDQREHSSLHFNSVPLALIIRFLIPFRTKEITCGILQGTSFQFSLWVLRELFVLSPYFSCRKDVSDALLHYWIDGRYVCQSFDLISDLPFNQILKFPGLLL